MRPRWAIHAARIPNCHGYLHTKLKTTATRSDPIASNCQSAASRPYSNVARKAASLPCHLSRKTWPCPCRRVSRSVPLFETTIIHIKQAPKEGRNCCRLYGMWGVQIGAAPHISSFYRVESKSPVILHLFLRLALYAHITLISLLRTERRMKFERQIVSWKADQFGLPFNGLMHVRH